MMMTPPPSTTTPHRQETTPALAIAIREELAALQAAELALLAASVHEALDPRAALQALVALRKPQSTNALGKKELIEIINVSRPC